MKILKKTKGTSQSKISFAEDKGAFVATNFYFKIKWNFMGEKETSQKHKEEGISPKNLQHSVHAGVNLIVLKMTKFSNN